MIVDTLLELLVPVRTYELDTKTTVKIQNTQKKNRNALFQQCDGFRLQLQHNRSNQQQIMGRSRNSKNGTTGLGQVRKETREERRQRILADAKAREVSC